MTIEEYIQYMSEDTSEWDWITQQEIIDTFKKYPDADVVSCVGKKHQLIDGILQLEVIRVLRPGDIHAH